MSQDSINIFEVRELRMMIEKIRSLSNFLGVGSQLGRGVELKV